MRLPVDFLAVCQLSMHKLKKQVEKCSRCPLADGRTNVVFGDGNENADVLIIGEAPGKNEDEQGLPFVGRAGQYLNELLSLAGLKREDVYIANVVKCRPPSNRDPRAEEIEQCSNYLREQTAKINPKIIVTLGNFATKFILKTEQGITKLHGQPVQLGKFTVLPVYHPAATMYDIKKKEALESDFAKIRTLI